MAEKTASKKDNNKNKKGKQVDKKRENGVRNFNEQSAQYSQGGNQKKKEKFNKNNSKPTAKKSSRSFLTFLLKAFLLTCSYTAVFMGFLYLVDYHRFNAVKGMAASGVDAVVGLLPKSVVDQGTAVVGYVKPGVQKVWDGAAYLAGQGSKFLSTNSLVKEHWQNVKEISSVCGARFVDYMRTLYQNVVGLGGNEKSKMH